MTNNIIILIVIITILALTGSIVSADHEVFICGTGDSQEHIRK